jgi:UDP-N-acetylmuramate dehydrogenase
MGFSYRHSFLKDSSHLFLIDAEFDLSEKREQYHSDVDNIDFRENKQPKGNCCGSFFKNPSKEHSAGSLIERVGLKGYRHGGAYWSDLHANFLMSDGVSCPPSDLIELVRLTQDRVKKETGIELVNEVRIIENKL